MEVVAVRGVFEGQKSFCCSAEAVPLHFVRPRPLGLVKFG